MKPTEIKRIGLFGGTFDPVHLGHLIAAETLRETCNLEMIFFIPAGQHALKDSRNITPAIHRLRMLELATDNNPHFSVNDLELNRKGVSFTIDTVKTLKKRYSTEKYQFFFMVGSDVVNEFHRWKSPDELLKLCKFVAFGREGAAINPKAKYASSFQFTSVPRIEISASEIRFRESAGKSIRYLVPSSVYKYIKQHALYQNHL